MSQGVELYGVDLADIPVIGEKVDSEEFLVGAANALSVARIIGGPAIAGYILSHAPENRSWSWGIGAGLLGASDRLDGDIIRALKRSMSEEQLQAFIESGRANRGARLDHMADKAFVIPPMGALATRGEISWAHPAAKVGRDVAVNKIKEWRAALNDGEYASASELARWKATVEMVGVGIGASPLAANTGPNGETTWTEYTFRAATALSLTTGAQYAHDLWEASRNLNFHDMEELIIDGPS